ncbi:hypothetical protein LCGC14_0439130 [marine sediment metagenome]|uniref:Uncharacterized protein n=1 Tax=marine sediment metagenome TaxID=412755 RepID=A0A0F9SKV8_9ZZZZ
MGKKHDEIVHSLNEEKLNELFAKRYFGEIGCWSQYHSIVDDEQETPLSLLKDYKDRDNITLEEFKRRCIAAKNVINLIIKKTPSKCLKIIRKVEVPLTKGEGTFKTTKGYLDLVCDIKPKEIFGFSCFGQPTLSRRIIIEVKQKKDFEDVGGIIRQVNEYKEYYNGNPSEIFDCEKWGKDKNIIWVIYCDEEIPKMAKEMIEEEGYLCLSGDCNKIGQEDGKK